jgi:hypothetical protein
MIDKNLGIDVGIGLDCRNRCQRRQRDREPDADAGGRPSMRTRGRAPFYAIRGAPSGQFAPRTETALLERSVSGNRETVAGHFNSPLTAAVMAKLKSGTLPSKKPRVTSDTTEAMSKGNNA